jgi:transketolase
VYYRLGKNNPKLVPNLNGRFELGRVQQVREGGDVVMLAAGSIAPDAVTAAELLAERGISCAVAVVACLHPPPEADLAALFRKHSLVVTVEFHYVSGGLGSLAAEVIAENGLGCRLLRCGVRRATEGVTGSEDCVSRIHGLAPPQLAETAEQWVRRAEHASGGA